MAGKKLGCSRKDEIRRIPFTHMNLFLYCNNMMAQLYSKKSQTRETKKEYFYYQDELIMVLKPPIHIKLESKINIFPPKLTFSIIA